jgi:hypothetical protein
MDEGFLPVFSVDTEEDAEALLILACPRNMDGEFVARELVQEQTLDNLQAFSDKLAMCYGLLVEKNALPSQKGKKRGK